MPLRFLRDMVFNDSEKTVPNGLSMQQQLQSLGIFTTLERPVQHPFKVFCKELLYYSATAFVITAVLLSIILPATERMCRSADVVGCITPPTPRAMRPELIPTIPL